MTDILSDLSSSSLAVAIKANMYTFFQQLRYSSEAQVHESEAGFRWHTAISHPWFNGFLAQRTPGEDADRVISETLEYFRAKDVAAITWWLTPSLESSAWSERLLARGFQSNDETPGMAMKLADLPPRGNNQLSVQQVGNKDKLVEWSRTFVGGFEMPESMTASILALFDGMGYDLPFRHYLGFLNGEPVATSTLFLGAGVAGIYDVATLPGARGQGIGSAMTLSPLYEAREMGYRAGILQSSKMGYGVYQRLGFRTLSQIDYFLWRNDNAGG